MSFYHPRWVSRNKRFHRAFSRSVRLKRSHTYLQYIEDEHWLYFSSLLPYISTIYRRLTLTVFFEFAPLLSSSFSEPILYTIIFYFHRICDIDGQFISLQESLIIKKVKMQNWPSKFHFLSFQSSKFQFYHFSPLSFNFCQYRPLLVFC